MSGVASQDPVGPHPKTLSGYTIFRNPSSKVQTLASYTGRDRIFKVGLVGTKRSLYAPPTSPKSRPNEPVEFRAAP